MGFLDSETIPTNAAIIIEGAGLYGFGVKETTKEICISKLIKMYQSLVNQNGNK